jgi:hypothetical protein
VDRCGGVGVTGLTPTQREALRVAREAAQSLASAYGVTDTIVVALRDAGLLRAEARPEHELGAEWAERLTAMKARADAASAGPWELGGIGDFGWTVRMGPTSVETEDNEQGQLDGQFIAQARTDVPALLDLVDLALVNIRQYQDMNARDSMRMQELEADASALVPELRESVRGWSDRCREADAEANALRIRNAELEARAAGPVTTWFLADSEGAEGGPTLHATLDAAKAWADGVEAAEWVEQDGVWVQCICDPDTDRPTHRGAGTVMPLALSGGAS